MPAVVGIRRQRHTVGCLGSCCAALLVALLCPPDAAARPYLQRSLVAVLDELRSAGLNLIYSDQVITADLKVVTEPSGTEPLALAREVLAPHRLTLAQAAPRTFSVVRTMPAAVPDLAATPMGTDEEVVVQASRYTWTLSPDHSDLLISQQQARDAPRLADELLRVVQRLPGNASNGFTSIGPIRGGQRNETAIILDGLRLYEPYHLRDFLSPVSVFDEQSIASVNFHSGGFPVKFGDRMGAVVEAVSVRPSHAEHYEAGLSLFHLSGSSARRFAGGRGQVLASARRSNLGELSRLSRSDFGEPSYATGFFRLDYRISDAAAVALHALVANDDVYALRSGGNEQARVRSQNTYTWATLEQWWSDRLSSRLIVAATSLASNRHGSAVTTDQRSARIRDRRDFDIIGLRVDNELDAGALKHRFGGELRELRGRYDYLNDTSSSHAPLLSTPADRAASWRLNVNPRDVETGTYWDTEAALGSRLTVHGGVRIDLQSYGGADGQRWSPRLGLRYGFGDGTQLRLSWGRFRQSQAINELQVEDGVDRFYPAQRSDHWIASLQHRFEAGLTARVEVYRRQYGHVTPRFENLFNPLVLFPEAEFDRTRIEAGSARTEGIDLLLSSRRFGPWSGWLAYSLSRAEDRIDGVDTPRGWDQRHAFNAALAWTHGNWTINVIENFHTGWPISSLRLLPNSAGPPIVDTTARNDQRFGSYNALDIRVTRRMPLPHGTLDIFVETSNTLSHNNSCCHRYRLQRNADGALEYTLEPDSWLPLVPSAGVLWRFGR